MDNQALQEYIQQVWFSWKRSITSWRGEQAQLLIWSAVSAVATVYTVIMTCPGSLFLLAIGALLSWLIPYGYPILSISIVAVCIIAMRPTVLDKKLHLSIYDMYCMVYAWTSTMLHTIMQPFDREILQGRAGDEFIMLVGWQSILWASRYVSLLLYIAPHVAQQFAWYHIAYTSPWIMFTCFFIVDAGYQAQWILLSVIRGVRMLWYNLPVCLMITGLAMVWAYIMSLWQYTYILDYLAIPFWISLWYTIYLKSIHEQFSRYYGDIYACSTDTA